MKFAYGSRAPLFLFIFPLFIPLASYSQEAPDIPEQPVSVIDVPLTDISSFIAGESAALVPGSQPATAESRQFRRF